MHAILASRGIDRLVDTTEIIEPVDLCAKRGPPDFGYFDRTCNGSAVMSTSQQFRDADGFISFVDYKGFLTLWDWKAQWRNGFWRSFRTSFLPYYFWHQNGRPFRRGFDASVFFEMRSDWGIGLDAGYGKFDGQTDETYTLSITRGVSNRFRRFGIRMQTGRLANRPASFLGPEFSFRVFRRLDLTYGGAVQISKELPNSTF